MKSKQKQLPVYVATETNFVFGIVKGMQISVHRIYFRNGEHHLVAVVNGERVEYPAIFFELK